MVDINYFCSLGHLCHASALLKKAGLKKMSFPFDWIFSDLSIVCRCIEDDFVTFLDKSHYTRLNDNQCAHNKYHPCMFNHHNLLNNQGHYEYFVRCVARFKALLASDKNKVFVITSTNNNITDTIDLTKLHDFNNTLKKYTTNYRIAYIYQRVSNVSTRTQSHSITTIDENIDVFDIRTISKSSGMYFFSFNDDRYVQEVFLSKYNQIDLIDTIPI